MDVKTNSVGRYEGRLFVKAGRLALVVEANEDSGMGRVSYRVDGEQQVVDMPLSEVSRRISSGTNLALDNVSGSDSSKRILRKQDGWFFSAREGLKGPYGSGEEAERELSQYILSTQMS
jgi:hypothetical protein